MPAEIDLAARREPAQFVVPAVLHDEGGFRIIVFAGNRLHQGVRRPGRHSTHGRLIAFEDLGRKRVDGKLDDPLPAP